MMGKRENDSRCLDKNILAFVRRAEHSKFFRAKDLAFGGWEHTKVVGKTNYSQNLKARFQKGLGIIMSRKIRYAGN